MKKKFLPILTAVLAAGFAFAVSGCEKEYNATLSENPANEEQTVDFSELTKNTMEDVSIAQSNINDAIEGLAKGFAGPLSKTGMSVEDFKENLWQIFSGKSDIWSDSFDYKDILDFILDIKNNEFWEHVSFSFEKGAVTATTDYGYYIKVTVESFTVYVVEIGKDDQKYAKVTLDIEEFTSALVIFDPNDNARELAGADVRYRILSPSYELWYDNAEEREGSTIAGTNIGITDLYEVINIISDVKDSYSYTVEEALEIVNTFNESVAAHNVDCTKPTTAIASDAIYYPGLDTPAILEGEPFCAAFLRNQDSGLCKVCLMQGENIVTTYSVIAFIQRWMEQLQKQSELPENVTVLTKEELEEIFSKQKETISEWAQEAELSGEQIDAINARINAIEKAVAARTAESESESGVSIASIAMTYTSKGADGTPITLSGKIYVPCKGSKTFLPVKDVVVNLYGTTTQGDGAFSSLVPLLYTYKYLACDSLAVFEPEYIGFGESSDYLQTYLCQHLIAENCSDMVVAGMQLLQDEYDIEFKDGWGTYITGYSQGGGNAMALTRYLTVDATNKTKNIVKLKKSYCGAGPYSPSLTFDTWRERGKMSMSLILPMVLYAMNEVHSDIFEGENLKDYFYSGYWASGVPLKVKNIEYAYQDASVYDYSVKEEEDNIGLLGPEVRLKYITAEDVLDVNSSKYQKLNEALTREIVSDDWTPEKPVVLFSDENDNVVPYENTQHAYSVLYEKAPDYVTLQTCNTGDHVLAMLQYNSLIANLFFGDSE